MADIGKDKEYFLWEQNPTKKDVFKLDNNRLLAMNKLIEIENIMGTLPLADCGLCGAPSCRAFAEDVVNGVLPKGTKYPRLGEYENGGAK